MMFKITNENIALTKKDLVNHSDSTHGFSLSLFVQSTRNKLKELQSLLGKLNFVSQCVHPGRIFVNRLLNWLR